MCGNDNYDDPHMNLSIDKIIEHESDSFILSFSTNLNKNPCEASFGVDDLIIYV